MSLGAASQVLKLQSRQCTARRAQSSLQGMRRSHRVAASKQGPKSILPHALLQPRGRL